LECADVIGVVEGGALWWRALERRLERRQGGTRLQHHRAQLCWVAFLATNKAFADLTTRYVIKRRNKKN
jgi:hypothetical protein